MEKTDEKKKKPKYPKKATVRASDAPRATVPPRLSPAFSRPIAAAKPKRIEFVAEAPRGKITAKASNKADEGEMTLFGTIGFDWFGEGVTSGQFDEGIKSLGGVKTIRLRVNSGGGDVFEGTQIYNILIKHGAKIIVEVEGVAASAATLIAMAGDEIRISENAHWMIHRASGGVWGNDDDVESYLKLLRNANELLRLTYSKRTGLSDSELVDMMKTDNWMTAQEALDHGFVDALDEAKSVKPHVDPDEDDEPEDKSQRPVQISSDRLAAMAASLAAFAANAGQRVAASATKTGDSPPTVTPPKKEPEMNAKLRAKCVAAGMPETLTGEAADKWCEDNFDKVMAPAATAVTAPAKVGTDGATATGLNAEQILDLLEARDKKRADARKAWVKEVDANLALAFPDHVTADLKDACYDLQADGIDAVRTKILEAKKKADDGVAVGGPRINFTDNQPRDRHIAAMRTGVLHRALSQFQPADDAKRYRQNDRGQWEPYQMSATDVLAKHLPHAQRAKGWEDFSHMPLTKLAEESLYADGLTHEQIRRMSGGQIAMAALGFHRQAGIRAEGAIHTTGSLAEITRDAINKSLVVGYEEAPQTWKGPMRQGSSTTDFKDIHRVRLGAVANIPVWVDNLAPEQAKLSNEKEKYAVIARAMTINFSWQLIINDDMDALSRRPQLMGDACSRTVNSVAWQQVTANGTLQDSVALFATATGARKRDNLITGAATPTNTSIGNMRKLMRLMRGLNTPEGAESDDVLNLTPTYIVGPAALEGLILKEVNSTADPASGGNSGVFNTSRNLIPVIEPLLDASSATAFYLFASPGRVDTVEVSFLEGFETPQAHEWIDDSTMCQNFTIIHPHNAKALDYRGMIKHAGA